jgi:hypothetical protein
MLNRLSYANVMATLALFVALGGSSYAAVKLSKGSVRSSHIARNAVTSSKVKDGSLKPADFVRGSAALAGTPGPKGEPGLAGPAGAPGPAGPAGEPARVTVVSSPQSGTYSGGTESAVVSVDVPRDGRLALFARGRSRLECTKLSNCFAAFQITLDGAPVDGALFETFNYEVGKVQSESGSTFAVVPVKAGTHSVALRDLYGDGVNTTQSINSNESVGAFLVEDGV